MSTKSTKHNVEVQTRSFDEFTVTSANAPAIQFERYNHGDRHHTSVNFHDATDLTIAYSVTVTDEGEYPTTHLTFTVRGERVNVTLFAPKAVK